MRRVLACLSVVVLVSACTTTYHEKVSGDTTIWIVAARGGGMGAQVAGIVEYDEDNDCFKLSGVPVFWPNGTTIKDNQLHHLNVRGIGLVKPGDRVVGGGGYLPPVEGFVPDGCLGDTGEVAFMERAGE